MALDVNHSLYADEPDEVELVVGFEKLAYEYLEVDERLFEYELLVLEALVLEQQQIRFFVDLVVFGFEVREYGVGVFKIVLNRKLNVVYLVV
jgi:hypothetical protein